jgi:putative membrane protein
MYGLYNGYGGGFIGMFAMLIFWIILIWIIVTLVRGKGHMCGHDHGGDRKGKSSLEILKDRYAKGEINKEQFDVIKKDIV